MVILIEKCKKGIFSACQADWCNSIRRYESNVVK